MAEKASTWMRAEIDEIPDVLQRQIDLGLEDYWEAGRDLAARDLNGFVTCARGTSDHAATFFKYLIEIHTGLPVASIGPSVGSLYKAPLKLENFACLTLSQSGGSPDLAALQTTAKAGGAETIAILNETDSLVGRSASCVLPIHAGPEKAVAATKSYIGMLFASLGLMAGFLGDNELKSALGSLPDYARKAVENDWAEAIVPVARAQSLFCVGRGPGLAVAGEAALKFKETCHLHAEAYSAAEILHGPVAVVDPSFATLFFDTGDASQSSLDLAEEKLLAKGATVFRVSVLNGWNVAEGMRAGHPLMEPVLHAISFYGFVEALSVQLGFNPDAPVGLKKVTQTI